MSEGPDGPGGLRFGETMTGAESLMWRLGLYDQRFRATMVLMVGLGGELPTDVLRDRVAEVTERVPRLRDRVVEPPGGLAMVPPRWEPDPEFEVGRHVAGTSLSRAQSLEEVAAAEFRTPFPARHPPWRVVPAADGVVLHLHHSYTDGQGGVRLITELFDFDREGAAAPARRASPEGSAGPGQSGFDGGAAPGQESGRSGDGVGGWSGLRAEVARGAALWGRAAPWARRALGEALVQPEVVLRALDEGVAALRTQIHAARGPATPLLSVRSSGATVLALDVPLDDLRRSGSRLGATVNDVFLSALLEGLAAYHSKHGKVAPTLRLGIPISARRPAGAVGDGLAVEMHNQLQGAVLRGPLGGLDFEERTRLLHEMVLSARRQPWSGLVDDLADAAARLPGVVPALAAGLSSLDVLASNVAGPPAPMYLAGRPVVRMVPVGPRSGAAVNATLLSYNATASIGFNVDPASVPDVDVLADCLRAGFEESLACG